MQIVCGWFIENLYRDYNCCKKCEVCRKMNALVLDSSYMNTAESVSDGQSDTCVDLSQPSR